MLCLHAFLYMDWLIPMYIKTDQPPWSICCLIWNCLHGATERHMRTMKTRTLFCSLLPTYFISTSLPLLLPQPLHSLGLFWTYHIHFRDGMAANVKIHFNSVLNVGLLDWKSSPPLILFEIIAHSSQWYIFMFQLILQHSELIIFLVAHPDSSILSTAAYFGSYC